MKSPVDYEDISTPSSGITGVTATKKDGIVMLAFSGATANGSTHQIGTLSSGLYPKIAFSSFMRLKETTSGKYQVVLVSFDTSGNISFSEFIPNDATSPFWNSGSVYGTVTYVSA